MTTLPVNDHERQKLLDKMSVWLKDGSTWIGVFENHDLGHLMFGSRVAIPFDVSNFNDTPLGMRAPDINNHILWRYVLVAKCRTLEEAEAALFNDTKH